MKTSLTQLLIYISRCTLGKCGRLLKYKQSSHCGGIKAAAAAALNTQLYSNVHKALSKSGQ